MWPPTERLMITGIMIKREITVFVFFFISQLSPNKFYLYNPVSSKTGAFLLCVIFTIILLVFTDSKKHIFL